MSQGPIEDGIADLTPGHLRIMEVLEPPADPNNPGIVWSTDQISKGVGQALSPVAFRAALGGLVARGLIEVVPGMLAGPGAYRLTDFGRALLGAARRAAVTSA